MSSLWKLPILFVLEDNHYAQTTPVEKGVAGTMLGRFTAFGITTWERDTTDVLVVRSTAREAIALVRAGNEPAGLILHTHRFSAHSKGDDPRTPEELTRIRQFDPLTIQAKRLTADECARAEVEATDIVVDAFRRAEADPFPTLGGGG